MVPSEVDAHAAELQLLDVREQHEWVAGHIEGALHVPISELDAHRDEFDTTRLIVTVCRSGPRAAAVAAALNRAGYRAEALAGGLEAWAAAGMPLVAEGGREPRLA